MTSPSSTVAILGSGKIGTALARLALAAGHEVRLASSGRNPMAAMIAETLAPGARLVPAAEAVDGADLVVLAVPMSAEESLDWEVLSGQVVIDLMNDWHPGGTTGQPAREESTTQRLARRHPDVRLVKSLNHIAYDDLEAYARPHDSQVRWGVLVAGDDADAAQQVARFVDSIGYDPVVAPAAVGVAAEPDGPLFGRRLSAAEIVAEIGVPAAPSDVIA